MKKRQALNSRIDKHQDEAQKYIPGNAIEHISETADNAIDDGWEDIEESVPQDLTQFTFSIPLESQVSMNAEKKSLFLPSSIGYQTCIRFGLQGLVERELVLRQGQANDALQGIRAAIGEKSFRFRKQLRNAKAKVQKTRSWNSIQSASKRLQQHRLIYRQARQGMIQLGASPKILKQYQELTNEDIRTSTAVEEPNARGQRNVELSWIWRLPGFELGKEEMFRNVHP